MAEIKGQLRRSWLGRMLRDRREAHGMTLAEPARHLNRSQSMVSRMENAQIPIQRPDLDALLHLYEVDDPGLRQGFIDLHAQSGLPAWWDLYAEIVPDPVLDQVWLESMARRIETYCATVVDGLLQTAGYAVAVAEAGVGTGDVDRWVEMLTLRQAVLSRTHAPPLTVIVDEGVLRRPVGGAEVMADQLRHLVRSGERPGIEVRVLATGVGAHAALDGGFTLLQLPPPLEAVAASASAIGLVHVGPPHDTRLGAAYDRLRRAALEPGASADLITEIADQLDKA
jgi:transcriptional regulator with XRE-family HTH domain